MSVVNEMLKDLEVRHSTELADSGKIAMNNPSDANAVNDTEIEEMYLQRHRRQAGMGMLWLITCAVFVLCLGLAWWVFTDSGSQEASQTNASEELLAADVQGLAKDVELEAAEEPAVSAMPNDVKAPRNQVVELAEEKPPEALPQPKVITVEQLLSEAETALAVDRLTTPPGDNAYDRFMAVLALQPDNQQALDGVEKIRQRYLGFIKSLVERGEFYAVPTLTQKARDVGANEDELQSLLAMVKEGEPAEKLNKIMKAFEPVKRKPESNQQAGVKPSLQERDRLVASKSEQLISHEQYQAAEQLLSRFLEENPKSVESVTQLFAVYLRQNRLDDAEALINRSQHLPGYQFSYMVAQVLIKRQDLAGALRALESQNPPLAEAPAYYALQAGLHHQRGQNDKAIKLYQSLINLEPNQASYWLGLAVSLDSLGLSDPTLTAFQKVLQYSKPNDSYISYVKQRITALSSPTQTKERIIEQDKR